ncbi:hypothetical protein [Bradyrhizobium sp.]|uniref:hypothetical protein n=1 Tax=Bradyrhizobium sp. TaxID=376 RepID=UPI0039E4F417
MNDNADDKWIEELEALAFRYGGARADAAHALQLGDKHYEREANRARAIFGELMQHVRQRPAVSEAALPSCKNEPPPMPAVAIPMGMVRWRNGEPFVALNKNGKKLEAGTMLYAAPPEKQTSHSEGEAGGDLKSTLRGEIQQLAQMADAAMNQSAGDMRNIMEDIAEALTRISGVLFGLSVPHSLTVAQGDARSLLMEAIQCMEDRGIDDCDWVASAYAWLAKFPSAGELAQGDERPAFEAWAQEPIRAEKLPLEQHPNGAYKDHRSYTAWYGWQARAYLSRQHGGGDIQP